MVGATMPLMLAVATVAGPPVSPTLEIAPGVEMPRINLGTCCGSEVAHAFPAWYGAGGRGVDTAFDYGKEVPGGKQTDLRKAIETVGAKRGSLFITTKVRAGLDPLHGLKLCIGLESSGASYALKAVRADLAELNVSQVDLVLLHAPCDSDATNAQLWKGLEQALTLNLTRAIGVSNYPKKQLGVLLAQATIKPAVQQ
jgi:2,5-diketo-D-gluconate reductase A